MSTRQLPIHGLEFGGKPPGGANWELPTQMALQAMTSMRSPRKSIDRKKVDSRLSPAAVPITKLESRRKASRGDEKDA